MGRAVAEIVAYLTLLGAVALTFLALMVIIPDYYSRYHYMAMTAAYTMNLPGFRTTASLVRVESGVFDTLYVVIHGTSDNPVTVSYTVDCINITDPPRNPVHVARIENVAVPADGLYYESHSASVPDDYVCVLTVEEPGLLIYSVYES